MRAQHRKILAWVAAGGFTLAVIALTPFLLQAAAPASGDWDRLSDISQTYGALSVLFSAAALLGVAASLVYQARQTAVSTEEAQRSSHRELLLISIENPELLACWEPIPHGVSLQVRKQIWFVNLIVSNWDADYRLKRTNDAEVRLLMNLHFQGEIARLHWHHCGANWRAYSIAVGERRRQRFVDLVDEVYRQSVAAGPPVSAASYYSATPE
ncbi:DUF6082 family protein [[Kitasatospora] papulosa]|uniref:DUF6082 family protein n=1 Tax=[Kitasatospora] papulosa TaxID=1464011 RepID=UPI002E310460|nr:DUF6082 family protein [[Kitasatospora] papulosa]